MSGQAASLKSARIGAGLSEREASLLLGISRQTIRQMERGRHRPPAPRVAYFLNQYDRARARERTVTPEGLTEEGKT